MANRKQLQERYEEAMFALLLDDVAEEEGQELLKLAEELNHDPDAAVPEELDQSCKKLISDAVRKEKLRRTGRVTIRVLRKVAIVAIAAVMLFAVAYATIPEFRVGFLNLMLTIADDGTDLTLHSNESGSVQNSNSVVSHYTMPEIPAEYKLIICDETETGRDYWYQTEDGKIIAIDMSYEFGSTVYTVDTEDAVVTDVNINGYAGICSEKIAFQDVIIAWADTDHAVFFSIWSNTLDKEPALDMAEAIKYVD